MDEKKKAKLGTRWTCFSCTGSFYDLHKPEPICPRCGADQRESPALEPKPKAKRKRKQAKKAKKVKINPALVREEEQVEMVDDGPAQELGLEVNGEIQLEVESD